MENGNPTSISPLEERIRKAAKIMGIDGKDIRLHLYELGVCLKKEPGTVEEEADALALLEADTTQEGDARCRFCESPSSPSVKIVRFKAGWAILKGKAEKAETKENTSANADLIKALRQISQYSDEELLKEYSENCSTEISDELRTRAKDKNFIIFDNDKVLVDHSRKLLSQARRGANIPETFMFDKKLYRTYKVGEFPMSFVEECPIHPQVILVDGYCETCQNTWAGISDEDRIVVRIAAQIKAIRTDLQSVNELIEKLRTDGSAKSLLAIPQVGLAYNEMKEDNRLPILRRRFSKRNGGNDPFYVKHKTY